MNDKKLIPNSFADEMNLPSRFDSAIFNDFFVEWMTQTLDFNPTLKSKFKPLYQNYQHYLEAAGHTKPRGIKKTPEYQEAGGNHSMLGISMRHFSVVLTKKAKQFCGADVTKCSNREIYLQGVTLKTKN